MHIRSKWFLVGVVVTTAACMSHDDQVSRERCEQVRDHMIDLRLDEIDPKPNPYLDSFHRAATEPAESSRALLSAPTTRRVDRRAHRASLQQALGEAFITSCQSNASSAQLQCALDASSSTAATACYRQGRSS